MSVDDVVMRVSEFTWGGGGERGLSVGDRIGHRSGDGSPNLRSCLAIIIIISTNQVGSGTREVVLLFPAELLGLWKNNA